MARASILKRIVDWLFKSSRYIESGTLAAGPLVGAGSSLPNWHSSDMMGIRSKYPNQFLEITVTISNSLIALVLSDI